MQGCSLILLNRYMEAVNINTALHKPKEALKCAALAKELDKDCFGEDHTEYGKSLEIVRRVGSMN